MALRCSVPPGGWQNPRGSLPTYTAMQATKSPASECCDVNRVPQLKTVPPPGPHTPSASDTKPGRSHDPALPFLSRVHPQETTIDQPDNVAEPLCGPRTTAWEWDTPRTDLPDVTFRHSGWQHLRVRIFKAMMSADVAASRLERFDTCGKHAWVMRSKDDPSRYCITSDHCHDRFCLPCANSRSRTIARNVLSRLQSKKVRFITLTLRAKEQPLDVCLARLQHAFTRLRARKLWTRGVTGGVAFLEVKRSETYARWHVHLHILAEGSYIDKNRLSRTWHQITGDSFVVDIRLVKDLDVAGRYVAKYASKPLDRTVTSDIDLIIEAVKALKGKRLCTTLGSWRGESLTEPIDAGDWVAVAPLADLLVRKDAGDPVATAIIASVSELKSWQQRGPPQTNSLAEPVDGPVQSNLTTRQSVPSVLPF